MPKKTKETTVKELNKILEETAINLKAWRSIETEAKKITRDARETITDYSEKKLERQNKMKGTVRLKFGKIRVVYKKSFDEAVDIDEAFKRGILKESDINKYSSFNAFGTSDNKLLLALVKRRINKYIGEDKSEIYGAIITKEPRRRIEIVTDIPEERELIVVPKVEYEKLKSLYEKIMEIYENHLKR